MVIKLILDMVVTTVLIRVEHVVERTYLFTHFIFKQHLCKQHQPKCTLKLSKTSNNTYRLDFCCKAKMLEVLSHKLIIICGCVIHHKSMI